MLKTSKSSSIQKVSELKRRNGCGWEDNVLDTKGKTEFRFLNFIKKKRSCWEVTKLNIMPGKF